MAAPVPGTVAPDDETACTTHQAVIAGNKRKR